MSTAPSHQPLEQVVELHSRPQEKETSQASWQSGSTLVITLLVSSCGMARGAAMFSVAAAPVSTRDWIYLKERPLFRCLENTNDTTISISRFL